jgi:hypothetical protein
VQNRRSDQVFEALLRFLQFAPKFACPYGRQVSMRQ